MSIPLEQIIPRKHITRALQSAVLAHPLVVLTAPVGYGKTMAARALMQSLDDSVHDEQGSLQPPGKHKKLYKCVYLPVSPDETAVSYLWERQSALLTSMGSPLGDVMRRSPFPLDSAQRAWGLEQLRILTAKQPLFLVIDDYQYADFPEYNAHLERLARAAAPNLRILLLSRTRPGISLEELRLKGLCAVFDQSLLVFSKQDAARFFKAYGIPEPAVAHRAWQISEGWGAALWLAAQGYLRSGTLSPVSEMHNLLDRAVFQQYRDTDQRLLLQLSVFDSFTEEQATYLSGENDAADRLATLREGNPFLQYDAESRSYRMHSLLRSLCATLLAAAPESTIDKSSLLRRAGEWCLQNDNPVGGIHFFAKAGRDEDYERILDCYEKPESRKYIEVDPEGIAAVGMRIPPHVRLKKPVGYISFLYSYAIRIDKQEGLRRIDEAEKVFAGEVFSAETTSQVLGHIAFARGVLAFNDYAKTFVLMGEARTHITEPVAISHRKLIWTFGSPHAGFLYLTKPGDYEHLVEAAERGWPDYYALSNGCGLGGATLMHAEFLLETGKLDKVEAKALQAIQEAAMQEQTSIIFAATLTLARLRLAQKRGDAALALFRGPELEARKVEHALLANSFDLALGYTNACLGRLAEMPGWLRRSEVDTLLLRNAGMAFAYIVQGKTLLLQQQYIELLALTKYMRQAYSRHEYLLGFLHSYILEAIAVWHTSGIEDAASLLQKALELARPDNLYLLFAEYGKDIEPILRLMPSDETQDPFFKKLLGQTAAYGRMSEVTIPKVIKEKKLTLREKKMLDLVGKGKSNLEIAQHFSVKRVTVTKALGNAYRKLGVKNRTQAVLLTAQKSITG